MRRVFSPFSLALWTLCLVNPSFAGEPVEDVDLTVEQVPGAGVFLESTLTAPFDRITLGGPREFLSGLSPERLPPGWVMSRDGRKLVLAGPAITGPVRIRLQSQTRATCCVDWDVSLAGREVLSRRKVVPRVVPQWVTKNSLQGVVVMPEEVSPGEAIALQGLPGSDLPAGGRFVISGVVSEPIPAEELAAATTPSRRWVHLPAAGLTLVAPPGTGCDELAPLAAVLGAGAEVDPTATQKSYYESRSNTANVPSKLTVRPAGAGGEPTPGTTWQVASFGHETAKSPIKNIRYSFALAPGAGDTQGISIKEKGIEVWDVSPESTAFRLYLGGGPPPPGGGSAVTFQGTPTADGCAFTPRDPDLLDLARLVKGWPPRERPLGKPNLLTHALRLPDDLRPGDNLSLQYLDRFGDLYLDVPDLPSTEVVPPAPAGTPPCVRAATPFALPEDAVCVCGSFPTLPAQSGVWLDERSAGTPLTTSTRSLEFSLPERARALGRHVWSGDPAAGFAAPGTAGFCRAFTQVIQITGEVDAARLQRGESTQMRLTVSGTSDRVPIRLRNLSPAQLRLEGGDEQTIESSGGSPNMVTRTVSGLQRGNFNIEWTLAVDRCPCSSAP